MTASGSVPKSAAPNPVGDSFNAAPGAAVVVVTATVVVGSATVVAGASVVVGAAVVVVTAAVVVVTMVEVVDDATEVVVGVDSGSSLPQATVPTTISTDMRTVRVATMAALSHANSDSADQGVRFCPTFNEL